MDRAQEFGELLCHWWNDWGCKKKNTANVAVFLFLYFGLAAENRFMVVLQLSIFPQTILLLLSLFLVTFLAAGIWIPWQCVVPATWPAFSLALSYSGAIKNWGTALLFSAIKQENLSWTVWMQRVLLLGHAKATTFSPMTWRSSKRMIVPPPKQPTSFK